MENFNKSKSIKLYKKFHKTTNTDNLPDHNDNISVHNDTIPVNNNKLKYNIKIINIF